MKKFNLQEALTGMSVITRTGKPITKIWYNKEADENGYPFPIIAWSENNTEYHSYTKNGKYLEEVDDSLFDLFMLANEIEELKSEKLILSDKNDQPKINDNRIIEVRIFGKWKKEAFWLDNKYNWKLEKDEEDEWCLIPFPKYDNGDNDKE